MKDNQDIVLTDKIKDLIDIEFAFTRVEALCNVLIEYIHTTNESDELIKKDNIAFTLMTIRDLTEFYERQVQNLQIIDGELKPIKESEAAVE